MSWVVPLYVRIQNQVALAYGVDLYTHKLRVLTGEELLVGRLPMGWDANIELYVVAYDKDRSQVVTFDMSKDKVVCYSLTEFKKIATSTMKIRYCTIASRVKKWRNSFLTGNPDKDGFLTYTVMKPDSKATYNLFNNELVKYTRLPKNKVDEVMQGLEVCLRKIIAFGATFDKTLIANKFTQVIKRILIEAGYLTTCYDWEVFITRFVEFVYANGQEWGLEMLAEGVIVPQNAITKTDTSLITCVGNTSQSRGLLWTLYGLCPVTDWERIIRTLGAGFRFSSPNLFLYPSPHNVTGFKMIHIEGYYERIVFAPITIESKLIIKDFNGEVLDLSNILSPSEFMLVIDILTPHSLKRVIIPDKAKVLLRIINSDTKPTFYTPNGKRKYVRFNTPFFKNEAQIADGKYGCAPYIDMGQIV